MRQNPLLRVEEGSWLLKPTPSWKGSVALMMVWATVSPFLQVSVPPQYLQHIYTVSIQELDHRHGLLGAVGDRVPDPMDEDRQ